MKYLDTSKTLYIIFLVFFALSAAHAGIPPIEEPDPDDLPVNIAADSMKYDQDGSWLTARGNVEIVQGERILKADYIRINVETQDTVARGNVLLIEKGDRIECDSFNINLDTQLGHVKEAKLFIKEQNLHIEGKNIQRLGLNTYNIKKGKITTCDGKYPAWRIDAGNIDITFEGYAQVKNSLLRLKGLPIMYMPYAFFPVKTKRSSGFLFPDISHSSNEGFKFDNSFFWAITDNTDATIWLDYATKRGVGTGLEYRFRLAENTWGKFYGYFIEEDSEYFDDEYRHQRDRDRKRYYVNFEGEHYFDPQMYVKAQASYVSDREMYGDYRSEIKRTKSATRKASLRSREKDESVLFFNKNWDFHNLVLNVNTFKNLVRGAPETVQRMPQVVYSSMRRRMGATGMFYQMDASYDYFWREEGEKGHRIDVFPKISFPRMFNGWLQFNPELGLRGISYYDIDRDDGKDTSRLFPSVRAELSTSFYRVYNMNTRWVKKVKHSIEPGVLYEYIPSEDQTDFPEFDEQERFFQRHSVTYYLKHRFAGLLTDVTGDLVEREIGYFLIGQTYNLREPRGLYLKGDYKEHFSDIFGELRFGVFPALYIKAKAAYSPDENMLRYYNVLLSWSNLRGDYIQFQYRHYRKNYEIFDVRGNLKLTHTLSFFFDARYDGLHDEDLDTEFGFEYNSQCWGHSVWVETSGGTGGRESDVSFHYSFNLKGLGESFK